MSRIVLSYKAAIQSGAFKGLMKIVRITVNGGFRDGESFRVKCIDTGDVIFNLESSLNEKEVFMDDHQAVLVKGGGRDKGVGDSGFVFKRNKDMAFGRARALAADDHSGDGDEVVGLSLFQV